MKARFCHPFPAYALKNTTASSPPSLPVEKKMLSISIRLGAVRALSSSSQQIRHKSPYNNMMSSSGREEEKETPFIH